MADKRDYYEVLGVDKNADEAALKKAYRVLAKKYHSMVFQTEKALQDVGDGVDAAEKEKVQAEIDKVKAILERTTPENMSDADVDELKAAKESLMTNAQQVFAKVYEQAQQAAGGAQGAGPDMSGAGAGPNPGAGAAQDNSGDDVVDGDFREL